MKKFFHNGHFGTNLAMSKINPCIYLGTRHAVAQNMPIKKAHKMLLQSLGQNQWHTLCNFKPCAKIHASNFHAKIQVGTKLENATQGPKSALAQTLLTQSRCQKATCNLHTKNLCTKNAIANFIPNLPCKIHAKDRLAKFMPNQGLVSYFTSSFHLTMSMASIKSICRCRSIFLRVDAQA